MILFRRKHSLILIFKAISKNDTHILNSLKYKLFSFDQEIMFLVFASLLYLSFILEEFFENSNFILCHSVFLLKLKYAIIFSKLNWIPSILKLYEILCYFAILLSYEWRLQPNQSRKLKNKAYDFRSWRKNFLNPTIN